MTRRYCGTCDETYDVFDVVCPLCAAELEAENARLRKALQAIQHYVENAEANIGHCNCCGLSSEFIEECLEGWGFTREESEVSDEWLR